MIPQSIIYKSVVSGKIVAASGKARAWRIVKKARKFGLKAFVGIGSPTEKQIGKIW